ncbi:hypothetical protein [Staphylococcus succinus]|uniref:hypothetical protein n=1 Tax=Staphylococcus succinus TaxID=61015 RepID=UPI001304C067|nr:hypothetical protein [Staphylococcus succinus]
MKVINYKVKFRTIEYKVRTDKGYIFTYTLPKNTIALQARRKLKQIAEDIDNNK